MSVETRPRFDLETALKVVKHSEGWVPHLLDNEDGTYSVMSHITCEQCDYCDDYFEADPDGTKYDLYEGNIMIHRVKADPYSHEKSKRTNQ